MRNITTNGLFAEKPVLQQKNTVKKAINNFEDDSDFVYYLTHKTNNVHHKDGRIYLKINSNGELFAQSVSTYSETFFQNIEPKIKNLIQALIDKRYLTYSSCEGHGMSFRRYVGLAFSDEESREHLINEIKKLKLPGVNFIKKNSVSNNKLEFGDNGSFFYKEKINVIDKEDETETFCFNIQFHRSYKRYYFLEIVILKEVSFFNYKLKDIKLYLEIIKSLPLLFAKKFLVEIYTKKITDLIKSDKIKKYKF